jgi:hypothetical protein
MYMPEFCPHCGGELFECTFWLRRGKTHNTLVIDGELVREGDEETDFLCCESCDFVREADSDNMYWASYAEGGWWREQADRARRLLDQDEEDNEGDLNTAE